VPLLRYAVLVPLEAELSYSLRGIQWKKKWFLKNNVLFSFHAYKKVDNVMWFLLFASVILTTLRITQKYRSIGAWQLVFGAPLKRG